MGITIKNLKKAFGAKVIFDGFSCDLPDTGIVLISGRSGCGKTTLLRIISGIDKKCDCEISGFETVSYAFQEHRLLPWLSTIHNVLALAFDGADDSDFKKAKDLLLRLGFNENELMLHPGELSGGMKQRVSLARAFAHNADVLILDEPTKELDSELCNTVYEIIEEESKKRLVLLVTHEAVPESLPITQKINL